MVWKDIPGYEGIYQASVEGDIRRLYKNGKAKIMAQMVRKQRCGSAPYMRLKLFKDGKAKNCKTSRLVYEAFRGEIPKGKNIVHKNGDWKDNCINNLVAMTNSELGKASGQRQSKRKPVARINLAGDIVAVYPSLREAGRRTGLSYQIIADYCNGIYGPLGKDGYYYKWDEDIKY